MAERKTRPTSVPDDEVDVAMAATADEVEGDGEPPEGTVKIKYLGHASVRSFVEEDFTRHGIEGQGDVSFNHSNKWVAHVSPEAAGYLIGTREFEKA